MFHTQVLSQIINFKSYICHIYNYNICRKHKRKLLTHVALLKIHNKKIKTKIYH